jgi:hypothetical protein
MSLVNIFCRSLTTGRQVLPIGRQVYKKLKLPKFPESCRESMETVRFLFCSYYMLVMFFLFYTSPAFISAYGFAAPAL